MDVPRVIFEYSWIYNEIWKGTDGWKGWMDEFPASDEVTAYISRVEPLWCAVENDVLTEMANRMGLEWHRSEIPCYMVGSCVPFSRPLTMPIYFDEEYFLDVLTQELIHNLFFDGENEQRLRRAHEWVDETWPDETKVTRIHIPLHALHEHIYRELLSVDRLERDKQHMETLEDYARSWAIVEDVGYEKILSQFIERIEK